MAHLVEPLTLDFRSGHDSRVVGSSSVMEPAWDSLSLSLSLSLSAPPPLTRALSLKNKINL